MSKDLREVADNIIKCINEECAGLDNNERAMVLLLVTKLCACTVELDILDTMRGRKADK